MLTEATIFRGAFWFSLGTLFERVMFFILPIFIAPLGAASLGIFYLSLRIFNGIVAFPTNALNIRYTGSLRQYLEDPKSLQFEETAAFLLKAYFFAGLLLGTLFLILILIFAPFKSFAFLALAIPFAIANSYMTHLLRLLQRFKKIFFIQVIFIFLFQILYLMIVIKILHMGIGAAFAGQLLIAILISLASCVFLFDRLNLLGFFQKINVKMFVLSRLSFANLLFITFSPILDLLIVWVLFGFSTLGHYIVLLYLPLFIHRIPTTLFGMFLHVATVKTRKNEDITQISKQVFKWILLLTIPLFIAVLLFPSDILSNLFHKTYIKDLAITRLLAISYFLQSISWMAERILIAKNKKVLRVVSNYIFAFMFVLLSLIFALAPRSSAEPNEVGSFASSLFGIALAFLIASIFDSLVKYILVVKTTRVSFISTDHLKILAIGALASFAGYIFFFNNPLLFFPFSLIIYFAILWMLKIVRAKNLYDLRSYSSSDPDLSGESRS